MDRRQSLQTVERAAATAWAVYQRNVRQLSLAAICALAAAEAIRSDDGSYSVDGGLGRPLATSTLHGWLAEAREQFRDEYIKRPIIDMIQEEDERLEHLAAQWAAEAQQYAARIAERVAQQAALGLPVDIPAGWITARHNALDRHLRVLESRRKLLGIDRPVKVEVEDKRTEVVPDDELAAMQAVEDRLRAEQATMR